MRRLGELLDGWGGGDLDGDGDFFPGVERAPAPRALSSSVHGADGHGCEVGHFVVGALPGGRD